MLVGERMTEPSKAFAGYVAGPTDPAQWAAWLTNGAAEVKHFADAMRGSGQTLHFHTTDAPGEWVARREPDMVVLEHTHIKADVAVRGPATDLLLVLSRRRPTGAAPTLQVHGDRALFDHWIGHMDWVTD